MHAARRAAVGALILVLAAGCGRDEAPREEPRETSPVVEPRPEPLERPDPTKPSDFSDCPEGTGPRELAIPAVETVMRWCERSGLGGARVQHGPWEKVREGRVIERGTYQEGVRNGTWTLFWSSGKPQSKGEYRDGRRAGVWTFWREDGTEVRSLDYGDPGGEAIEVSESEAPPAPPITLRVENSRAEDLIFALEPANQAYAMPPGTVFEVRTRGSAPEGIRVEATEGGVTVWPGESAETTLLVDGIELDP